MSVSARRIAQQQESTPEEHEITLELDTLPAPLTCPKIVARRAGSETRREGRIRRPGPSMRKAHVYRWRPQSRRNPSAPYENIVAKLG